jgi:hypothetical protein
VNPENGDKKCLEDEVYEKRCCQAPVKVKVSEKKKREEEEEIQSDEDIDCIDEKLNKFMTKDASARRNWRKIKFRLQVIS